MDWEVREKDGVGYKDGVAWRGFDYLDRDMSEQWVMLLTWLCMDAPLLTRDWTEGAGVYKDGICVCEQGVIVLTRCATAPRDDEDDRQEQKYLMCVVSETSCQIQTKKRPREGTKKKRQAEE